MKLQKLLGGWVILLLFSLSLGACDIAETTYQTTLDIFNNSTSTQSIEISSDNDSEKVLYVGIIDSEKSKSFSVSWTGVSRGFTPLTQSSGEQNNRLKMTATELHNGVANQSSKRVLSILTKPEHSHEIILTDTEFSSK